MCIDQKLSLIFTQGNPMDTEYYWKILEAVLVLIDAFKYRL